MPKVYKIAPFAAAALLGLILASPGPAARTKSSAGTGPTVVVGYASEAALRAALARSPATVLRRLPALDAAVVRPSGDAAAFARALRGARGISYVQRPAARVSHAEPALSLSSGQPLQWQYSATRLDLVPDSVARAAASITIAVIDTGADLSAPDLAAKAPRTYNVSTRSTDVRDFNGHGTFVASLAAGSVTNNDGMAGAGGDAGLLIVQAGRQSGSFTDVEEAAAIVYAVDSGAKIINLSFGGPDTSRTEQRAIDYAVSKGVLLVAAVGNEFQKGNPVEYPAALLQPTGSNGVGGRGLAVGASTALGSRASFSNTGSHLSLVAPGERVLGALSSASSSASYPRSALPGASAGLYGYGSGTSFAVPQVSGAAALVWAANPSLTAEGVADVLEQTATGRGRWSSEVGYGVLDAAAAVERASGVPPSLRDLRLSGFVRGQRVHLSWAGDGASAYRLSVKTNGGAERVLLASTTMTGASYKMSAGYTYTFKVTALDATGVALSMTTTYTTSVAVPLRKSKKR